MPGARPETRRPTLGSSSWRGGLTCRRWWGSCAPPPRSELTLFSTHPPWPSLESTKKSALEIKGPLPAGRRPPSSFSCGGMMLLLLCRGHQSRWLERRRRSSASRRAAAAAAKCLFMLIAKCTSTITLLVPGKPGLLQCPLSPRLLLYISSWRHAKIRSGMAMTNGPSAPPLPFFHPGPLPYVMAMDR